MAIPEFIIFLMVGLLSYYELKAVLEDKNSQENDALRSEISNLLDFQDYNISVLERKLDQKLELASWELKELFFSTTDSIEYANLNRIVNILGIAEEVSKIDVIDQNGTIVNTTQGEDLGMDIFGLGKEFEDFILSVMQDDVFVSERFNLSPTDKRLFKWSNQSTNDHKYVIQIGVESEEVNAISDEVRKIISNISSNREAVLELNIFINPERPFSFATDVDVTEGRMNVLKSVFKQESDTLIEEVIDDREIHREYIYSNRRESNLYKALVVELVKDKTLEQETLMDNLMRKVMLFAIGLMVLFVILLINARYISRPIKLVSDGAKTLGSGHLDERVPVTGSKELKGLSRSFNQMAAELESSDKKIRAQKEKIEEAHEEIKDSISYAKRIQAAILPPDRLIKDHLANSFVLYKPKDIVAGDFYWFELFGNKILFAAADCTGHGVPGAMVSVICNNALNRSVREFGLSQPAAILDMARQIVISEFEKSEDEVMDGMDIAMCSLENMTLNYSGAHNPLYLVRNSEIIEYKADKQPIGIYSELLPFTNHEIPLITGDTVYIFSDGFADQFGGPKGKKYMTRRFKKLLLSIQSQSMDEQRFLLENAFDEWRGREEQIDDVCVIGFRV